MSKATVERPITLDDMKRINELMRSYEETVERIGRYRSIHSMVLYYTGHSNTYPTQEETELVELVKEALLKMQISRARSLLNGLRVLGLDVDKQMTELERMQ